jgi:hypothetical protein
VGDRRWWAGASGAVRQPNTDPVDHAHSNSHTDPDDHANAGPTETPTPSAVTYIVEAEITCLIAEQFAEVLLIMSVNGLARPTRSS